MSDDLPPEAVRAGAARIWGTTMKNATEVARAVLVAATERIECWYEWCDNGRVKGLIVNGEQGYVACGYCKGDGFLYVLKQEKT